MESMGMKLPNIEFWKNKRVFITGHTGFKGSWLILLLNRLGADVIGYALEPNTHPSLFTECNLGANVNSTFADIRELSKLKKALQDAKPSIVIHLAAQPLVRESYNDPHTTIETNVMGTVNLFEAVRTVNSIKAVINITTDKCYKITSGVTSFTEDDELGGYDPYSGSKACSEILTSTYRNSYFNSKDYKNHGIAVASARAGNVIGGGDWSADRLIPDIIRSIVESKDIIIRNPDAVRPWQHVLEPLTGYLLLAEQLVENGQDFAEAWNFGSGEDDAKSVLWIVEKLLLEIGNSSTNIIVDSNYNPHETELLKLNSSKANTRLSWNPKWNIERSLKSIADFVGCYNNNGELLRHVNSQISDYMN
jgi:CDP-glucose 4,6-dehydratase